LSEHRVYYINPITWETFEIGKGELEDRIKKLKEIGAIIREKISSSEDIGMRLEKCANICYKALNSSPFNKIPSDTRVPVNTISLTDHLISTSLIAYSIIRYIISKGETVQFIKREEFDKEAKIVLSCARLASLFHDISKPELQNHYIRSKEFFEQYIGRILRDELDIPDIIVDGINSAIEHHHGDLAETEFERIISFSDTISSAERIPIFNMEFWDFCKNEVPNAPELFNISEAIEIWKNIEKGNVPFEKISSIKNNKGFQVFPLSYEGFTSPILELKTKPRYYNDKCLCIFGGDVNSVKSFVKNSGKLKELRGSSYILRRIDNKIIEVFEKLLIPECLIYAKGGSFLSIIPNISALYEKLRDEINKLYENETKGKVSTTIADPIPFSFIELRFGYMTKNYWADIEEISKQKNKVDQANMLLKKYTELFNNTKTFGQLVKKLGNKIVENKINRINLSTSFNYASKIFKLCSSCNEDLGIKKYDDEYLCETCVIKREINEKIKTNEYKDTFHYKICQEYYNLTYEDAFKKFPMDLDRIVNLGQNKDSNLSDLIGFVMIDGNNFGAKLHRARTISEYKTISAELENLMVDLFLKALKGRIDINKFNAAPFDIFYIGGDDIFCVINGYYVIDVLNEYHKLIKDKLKNLDKYLKDKEARYNASIGFGAGVIFAKSRYPIKLAYDETDDLESRAKIESKKSSDICPFYIDFHSQKYLAYKLEKNYMDPRPIAISKLYDIYSYIELLYNNLSKSLLYSLLGLHFKSGEIFTRAYIHYQAGKNPDKEIRKYLNQLLTDPNFKLYEPLKNKIIYRGSLYYELSKLIRPK